MEVVDLAAWPRREHFRFFSGLGFPFYNVTTSLDVTRLHAYVRARGLSFYHALIYATLSVMNGLPDFLYKIRGEQVVKHEKLDPSFVTLDPETHLLKIVKRPLRRHPGGILCPVRPEGGRPDLLFPLPGGGGAGRPGLHLLPPLVLLHQPHQRDGPGPGRLHPPDHLGTVRGPGREADAALRRPA